MRYREVTTPRVIHLRHFVKYNDCEYYVSTIIIDRLSLYETDISKSSNINDIVYKNKYDSLKDAKEGHELCINNISKYIA